MRLLLTTDTVGGVWTFTRELTGELLHLGHSVALVSFGRLPSREQMDWCSTIQASHPETFLYEASPVPLEWMEANEASYTAGQSLLVEVAREFSPDLLHSSQFCFGKLPVSIPKLITAHSDVLSWSEACRPGGLEASLWLTRYCQLVQQGLDAADAVVAPTKWMLDAFGQHFSLPPSRNVVLNGRSLPDSEHGLSDALPRMLQAVSVGRIWDEAKNLSALTNLDSPLPILIAGEEQLDTGEPAARERIAASSAGPADPGVIQACGFLSEEQLLKLFHSSSIYIATSIYEPFGLAPLEAALCGCAVLANDIPSLREVWMEAALYFHDSASLCGLLRELKSSSTTLHAAQAQSLRRARELTTSRMTAGYVALYSSLVRGASSSVEVYGPESQRSKSQIAESQKLQPLRLTSIRSEELVAHAC